MQCSPVISISQADEYVGNHKADAVAAWGHARKSIK